MRTHSSTWRWISTALVLGAFILAGHAESVTNRFGFAGCEVYPIDPFISHLRAADLDGDGLQDLIVVNNTRSKINLLFNQTGRTNLTQQRPRVARRELNELPSDARFRMEAIASEKRITSLVVADLNGDGRPDVAYYGEPKELVLLYNQGQASWSAPKRWPINDGQLNVNSLVYGDLNGDGLTDLALLADTQIYLLLQQPDHSFREPERIPYSGIVQGLQILDIDGDGREDLLLVNWDTPNPLRIRLQTASGQLGPEIQFTLPPIRAYLADDLDGDHKTELVTIAQNSGRAQISCFKKGPAELLSGALFKGQLQFLPLNKTAKSRRGTAWADINGDHLPDLLIAEPDSGQLTVYFQTKNGEFAAPRSFPTFTGVTDLAVADWDGDGWGNIFLLSSDERQIGVTRVDASGRIPFPHLLPLQGRPLALAAGFIQSTNLPSLAMILDQDGTRILQVWSAEGQVVTQKLGESFKSNPTSLTIHDVNQDGLTDLVVLVPYEKVKVLLQRVGKPFEEQDVAPPGGSMEQPWLSTFDVDGDGKAELLLGQKNFVRAVVLKTDSTNALANPSGAWSFTVKEQINGAASNSRIVGAAGLPNGTNRFGSLFLLDAERKLLTLCERDPTGVWQVVRNVDLPLSEFTGLQPLALGSDRLNSIALVGLNTMAWMGTQGATWQLAELDGYETPIKDGFLMNVVSGDLNQDGRKDLVFLETAKNYLDLVTYEPPHQLVPADRWQVFEARTFRGQRIETPEPREALVVDLTGDGKNDLAIIVHDRILVYPQE